ncbi:MAG: signal recognition particle-docking protein FtsY [Pseudomonadota bacterium]
MAKNFLSGIFGRKNKDDDSELSRKDADKSAAETPASENPSVEVDEDKTPAAAPAEPASEHSAAPSIDEAKTLGLQTSSDPAPAYAPDAAQADQEKISPPTTAPADPVSTPDAPAPAEEDRPSSGWLSRLTNGLSRSSSKLSDGVVGIFKKRKLDDETLEELEDLLITADLGVATASRVTTALAKEKFDKEISDRDVRAALAEEVASTLAPLEAPLSVDPANKPHVILMIGVNGAGKTTTLGKLTRKFLDEGKSVMLAAGDTFRAAAIEQLTVWGERTGAPVISREVGADAAGLAFDALKEARDSGTDILMIDTAGRLQNKADLMDELAKIVRVLKKQDPNAPHDVVLVLDATVGQNAISQAEAFSQIAGVTGLIMTKLDGTARGGVLVAVGEKFQLPIHFIGVGESVEDLQPFNASQFAYALAGAET